MILAFFAYFWTHGGQTLGMRAWRLRLLRADGARLTCSDAALRWLTAWISALPAGLGYLWALVDREGLMWHDRWSGTRVTLVAKDE